MLNRPTQQSKPSQADAAHEARSSVPPGDDCLEGKRSGAFVNEYISEFDARIFRLEQIDQRYILGGTNARDWTIDRERDIYLRNVANGRDDLLYQSTWTLYWKGELIPLEIHMLDCGGTYKGASWAHKKLHRIQIPEHLLGHREEIIADLTEALAAYKDGGVFAHATTYDLTLEV